MALVAYSDDSDLGSDVDEVEEKVNGVVNKVEGDLPTKSNRPEPPPLNHSKTPPVTVQKSSLSSSVADIIDDDDDESYLFKKPSILSSIPAAVSTDESRSAAVVNEDDESYLFKKPSILSSIPAAVSTDESRSRSAAVVNEEDDELTDVPTVDTWKVIAQIKKDGEDVKHRDSEKSDSNSKSSFSSTKKKNKVKIFLPALSEFDDDEEEEEPKEEPERKKLKPSVKGTGLFSVLPDPKHFSVKEMKRPLIPYVLTKPPPAPKSARPKPKPVVEKKQEVANDSDEEDAGPSDFFSLSESSADLHATVSVPVPAMENAPPRLQISVPQVPCAETTVAGAWRIPRYKEGMLAESGPHHIQEESTYQYEPQVQSSGGAPDMDQEAMIRLMGKRRGKGETINFIDVSADDALLTRDEWMTKSLTEEKPTHSFSKKKDGLPSQKQKQKHQITYLAHQAKERELELKNNWAQNRLTKMQTQAKYGF